MAKAIFLQGDKIKTKNLASYIQVIFQKINRNITSLKKKIEILMHTHIYIVN